MRYFLGLGSNLGDKPGNLGRALEALERARVKVIRASSVYHTQPVGDTRQPWFYNQVIEVETDLSPRELLVLVKRLERALGRSTVRRLGPRPIDIDILLAGDRIISSERLVVPHPRMTTRNFVLVPLKEIAPHAVHPVLGVDIEELAGISGDKSIVRKVQTRVSGRRPLKKRERRSDAGRGSRS